MEKTINLDLQKLSNFSCPHCEAEIFDKVVLLKHVPGLLVGQQQATVIGMPTFRCIKCGHIVFDNDIQNFKPITPGLAAEG